MDFHLYVLSVSQFTASLSKQNYITQAITQYPCTLIISSYWKALCKVDVLKISKRNENLEQNSCKISVKEFNFSTAIGLHIASLLKKVTRP